MIEKTHKVKLADVILNAYSTLLDKSSRNTLGTKPINSPKKLTFEELNQFSGFVLYETILPNICTSNVMLRVKGLSDRGYIYLENNLIGVLAREENESALSIGLSCNKKLHILVESEGRINYAYGNDFKGILGHVFYDSTLLYNWTITGFPLDDYSKIDKLIADSAPITPNIENGPIIFHAEFALGPSHIFDTYLDPTGWGKVS